MITGLVARELQRPEVMLALPVARVADPMLTPTRWKVLVRQATGCRALIDGRGFAWAAYVWRPLRDRSLRVRHLCWIDLPGLPMLRPVTTDILATAVAQTCLEVRIEGLSVLGEGDEAALATEGFSRLGSNLVSSLRR